MNYRVLNEILSRISAETGLEREELDEWEIASNTRYNKEIVLFIGLHKSGKTIILTDCELIDNIILEGSMTFNTHLRETGCDEYLYERVSHLGFDYDDVMKKLVILLQGQNKFQ